MSRNNNVLNPSSVISLCVIDGTTVQDSKIDLSSKILVVVRDPATNPTHPNVVSVPTQRVPDSFLKIIISSSTEERRIGSTTYFVEDPLNSSGSNGQNNPNPIIYFIKNLISNKLGVPFEAQTGIFRFEASLQSVTYGISHYPNLSPESRESISMASFFVKILDGSHLIPVKTESYSKIFWSEIGSFIRATKTKDLTEFPLNLSPFEYCIHGLCISITSESLKYKYDIEV